MLLVPFSSKYTGRLQMLKTHMCRLHVPIAKLHILVWMAGQSFFWQPSYHGLLALS